MTIMLHDDYTNIPEAAEGCVLAIGNFDGIHAGHRAVIAAAKAEAEKTGAPLGVMTFEPHPREFFRPDGDPFRLTLLPAKARIFESLGVAHLFAVPFGRAFSRLTGDDFVNEVLKKRLRASHVVVGPDFSFGHERSGSVGTLRAAGAFGVTVLSPVHCGGDARLSSTRIRAHLAAAELEAAGELLGRPWEMEAEVIGGDRRGRTIGYPTANQDVSRYQRLPYGVYAVRVLIEGERQWREGAANFGIRPMFEVKIPLLETHILDYSQEIYGKNMRVRPVARLRPEMRLESLEALKAQIDRDCLAARAVLKSASLQETGK